MRPYPPVFLDMGPFPGVLSSPHIIWHCIECIHPPSPPVFHERTGRLVLPELPVQIIPLIWIHGFQSTLELMSNERDKGVQRERSEERDQGVHSCTHIPHTWPHPQHFALYCYPNVGPVSQLQLSADITSYARTSYLWLLQHINELDFCIFEFLTEMCIMIAAIYFN